MFEDGQKEIYQIPDQKPSFNTHPAGRAMASEAIETLRELFPPDLYESLFLVGGAVRDHLQDRQFQDLDLVTKLPAQCLLERGFHLVKGKSTDPIFFTTHSKFGKIEVCCLAQEKSFVDDLKRRDFRCNAVLMSLNATILDPLGGVEDIRQRVLQPCSAGILVDDPIRFFRALRFVSQGWRMSADLRDLLSGASIEEELGGIPVERFTREMCTAMLGDAPCCFFSGMVEFDVGKTFLPELFQMKGIPAGPSQYHGNDNLLEHSLAALGRMSSLSPDPAARLAALFHDLGKITTPADQLPRHIGHDRAGAGLARLMATRIRLPDRMRRAIVAACKLHLVGGRWGELRDSSKIKLAERALKSGIAGFFPHLIAADRNVMHPLPGWHRFVELVQMSATDLGMQTQVLAQMGEHDRDALIMQYRLKMLKRQQPMTTTQ